MSATGRRVAVLLVAAAAGGCIENTVAPAPSDRKEPVDSGSGVPDAPVIEACPEAPPTQGTAEISETCSLPPADWNLSVKWRWDAAERGLREAHVGRFEDSDGDGAITARDAVGILLVCSSESTSRIILSGRGRILHEDDALPTMGLRASIVDVDSTRVGMEYVIALHPSGISTWYAGAAAPGEVFYVVELPDESSLGHPFIADLDADGFAEAIGSYLALSAEDGTVLFTYGDDRSGAIRPVAADLDLDGLPEIITGLNLEPAILGNDGELRAVCPIQDARESVDGNMVFAVGNLDDDPEGEFAVVRPGILAICDSDGTVLASRTSELGNSVVIGIGELSGDGVPEVIVDEQRNSEAVPVSVAAYDRDLNPRWRHPIPDANGSAAFTLADLDGDGLHEILVHPGGGGLLILAPDGTELATIDGPTTGWVNAPIVTDIDGDGLAEIVVAGENPSLVVYTNDAGGWPVKGAQDPWPGVDHFPGDRNLDGTLPDPADVPWLIPGHNVWQGLAPGLTELPDIGIELMDACSDDCETTVITAWVSNHGAADNPMPITVELSNLEDGTLLGAEVLDGLPTGTSRALEFRVPTAAIGTGVRAVVSGAWAECPDVPNEAVLVDLPCR